MTGPALPRIGEGPNFATLAVLLIRAPELLAAVLSAVKAWRA